MELDYHLLLARDIGLLDDATYSSYSAEVVQFRQMLGRFIATLDSET